MEKVTIFVTFVLLINTVFKVSEVLRLLSADGWELARQRGSHRQFKHPIKKGTVTVSGKPSDDLSAEVLKSIASQAGIEFK